jgi:phosphoribosyl 1,2-cyclic phosphodiesterase
MTSFLCSLASGSLGNALVVASGPSRVLVDFGISGRRLKKHLAAAGVVPQDLAGVLVTHTHRDHFSASAVAFCLAHGTRVYSTRENLDYLADDLKEFHRLVEAGQTEAINGRALVLGDITVDAFEVPHDAPGQCLGFRLSMGGPRSRRAVAVATDLGHLPGDGIAAFLDADAVVLESNHDVDMLRGSGRPTDLVDRILGPRGHLSNASAAEALAEIVGRSHPGRVRHVILAHLSRDCNTPRLALAAQAHLSKSHSHPIHLVAAAQHEVGPIIEL